MAGKTLMRPFSKPDGSGQGQKDEVQVIGSDFDYEKNIGIIRVQHSDGLCETMTIPEAFSRGVFKRC